jgi:hypothetical protein
VHGSQPYAAELIEVLQNNRLLTEDAGALTVGTAVFLDFESSNGGEHNSSELDLLPFSR